MAKASLLQTHPQLVAEWHPTKNGDLEPGSLTAGSGAKVFWLGECGHEWETTIYSRASGRGCGYCVPGGRVLSGFNDFETLHPTIAAEWDHELNGEAKPSQFKPGSKKMFFWNCEKGHTWQAQIQKRVRGQGCGVCRNLTFVPGINDLAFLRPDIAADWDYEKNLADPKVKRKTPQEYGPGSEVKVWWRCKLGHSFDSNIDSRCRDGKGCRICAGRELLVGFNDLATKHPQLAKDFHPAMNGPKTPSSILAGTPIDLWWVGECGHEWEARLTNRVARDSGCPRCSPGGYSSNLPGMLYFIENQKLGAYKVGITNPSSKNDRLQMFTKAGWQIVRKWEHINGRIILEVETEFFKWLRVEAQIPRYLEDESMTGLSGSTETFAFSIISRDLVISKIEMQFESWRGSI